MKSPEESDLYVITPLRYDCTAKSMDRIKTTNVQSNSCILWIMFTNLIVIKKTNIGICFVRWKLNTRLWYLTLMFNLVTILSLVSTGDLCKQCKHIFTNIINKKKVISYHILLQTNMELTHIIYDIWYMSYINN